MYKYNQILLLVFSIFVIIINLIIGSSITFWFFLIGMLLIINLIWYCFNDIKWNTDHFIVEKFLSRREISSDNFIGVERLFLNVFVIRFNGSKFYYTGGIQSFFENADDITNSIKAQLLK